MQVKALVASLATVGFGVLAACGSNSPIEAVVEPGITAIRESSELTCNVDLANLLQAIESYRTLNIDPPVAESDLVPNWLRSESQLYDLIDGQIIPAAGSECPAITGNDLTTTPPTDSVTLPDNLGECEEERAVLQVAMDAYFATNGSTAASEADLVSAALLRQEFGGYDIVDGVIVPAPGSICPEV